MNGFVPSENLEVQKTTTRNASTDFSTLLEARIRGHVGFKASNGWFDHWRWRYNVKKSVRLQGEAGDIDIAAVEQDIKMLRCALKEYSPGSTWMKQGCSTERFQTINILWLMKETSDRKGEAAYVCNWGWFYARI